MIVQVDDLPRPSTIIVVPTCRSAHAAVFRPVIEVDRVATRVLVDQLRVLDLTQLGPPVGHVTMAEQRAIDDALEITWDSGHGDAAGRTRRAGGALLSALSAPSVRRETGEVAEDGPMIQVGHVEEKGAQMGFLLRGNPKYCDWPLRIRTLSGPVLEDAFGLPSREIQGDRGAIRLFGHSAIYEATVLETHPAVEGRRCPALEELGTDLLPGRIAGQVTPRLGD